MILIVGGTGILGSIIARRLLEAGQPVRILSRRPEKAVALRAAGAEVVQGDLLDGGAVSRACSGAIRLVAAAHSLFGRGRHSSVHVDGEAHRQLLDAARRAGVQHVVYTSVYDVGPAYRELPLFRMKLEIEKYLEASGLPYTILRPTAFMDVHAHMLIGRPVLKGRPVVLFGTGTQPRNFVAAEDVATVAIRALCDGSLIGRTLDVAGPENLTSLDVVRIYERAGGRKASVVRLPLGVARTTARLLRALHPGVSQMLQAAVLADTTDQRVDGRAIMGRLGMDPIRLEDCVARQGVGAS